MKSIRQKLFFQIGSLMILFILLLYLANTFFLETFYSQTAKRSLLDIYEEVNAMAESDYTSDALYQLVVNSRTYVDLVIFDNKNNIAYLPENPLLSSDNTKPAPKDLRIPPPAELSKENTETVDETKEFIWFTDKKTNMTFIMLNGTLDNGFNINIRIPMDSVKQNVTFLNQFILITGIIILIISIIAANQIAKHFTTPILNIFKVTDSIKNMDFSNTCEVITNDEIGRLAENINEMSYALNSNMNELANSNEKLKTEVSERLRIDEQRKALLNNVSHELKTPLSLVQGYSEGLKLNLHKNKEKTDFYCDVIIDEAQKMDLLVSQLLDINRLQFGDFPLHKEPTKAKAFLEYILKKYDVLFKEKEVAFRSNVDLLDENLSINIDSLRSEQVLTNLLNNALAYVNEEKIIKFITDVTETGHLKITVSNSVNLLPKTELEKLWNSFYKLDKARTRENGGYGLGLSIIKAIQDTDNNSYGVYQKNDLIHFWVEFDLI